MSDVKLFRVNGDSAVEITGAAMTLEKPLQNLIEANMDALFAVRFLATEYTTGKKHGGRIDSLGVDENGSPVILEYKRDRNQNVINQGLYYLDWLMDHRGEFELLVQKKLGHEAAQNLDWSNPRLICVANDFTRYDEHAVLQIDRSIELVRYRSYGGEMLLLELLTSTTAKATAAGQPVTDGLATPSKGATVKTVVDLHDQADHSLRTLYAALEQFMVELGDDVTKKVTKNYYAFRRLKNFACVEIHPQAQKLAVYVKANLDQDDPDGAPIVPGLTRDVSKIGHFGTGNLEITLSQPEHLEQAKTWIAASYEAN